MYNDFNNNPLSEGDVVIFTHIKLIEKKAVLTKCKVKKLFKDEDSNHPLVSLEEIVGEGQAPITYYTREPHKQIMKL